MISDYEKVTDVMWAYRTVLVGTKRSKFIVIKIPPTKSKHFQNCVQFFDSAKEFGATVGSLMLACLDHFPPYWCQRRFKRKYPSAPMLVSEKSRNRGLKNFPAKCEGGEDRLAWFYAKQLGPWGRKSARRLLDNGFIGDIDLDRKVCEILQNGRKT